jgi:transcriptional regulator with GAF, ATPase, and Fis domain
VAPLTEADRERLRHYDWPGNIRELQNVIERAWITSLDGRRLNLARGLPGAAGRASTGPDPAATSAGEARVLTAAEILELERSNTLRALEAAAWKIAGANGAAARLGLNPNTLTSRLRALGIRRPARAQPS